MGLTLLVSLPSLACLARSSECENHCFIFFCPAFFIVKGRMGILVLATVRAGSKTPIMVRCKAAKARGVNGLPERTVEGVRAQDSPGSSQLSRDAYSHTGGLE